MKRKTAPLFIFVLLVAAANASAAEWPVLKHYDQGHIARIALPLGGIGTGTVSLGGRGDLRDWEIMNRPAKGYHPGAPFFAVRTKGATGAARLRVLTGPVELFQYEGGSGVKDATNPGLPTFRNASFDAAYPFGVVNLSDPGMPVKARVKGWNPLIPTDAESSGLPIAVLVYEITNTSAEAQTVTVCGTLQNFIGDDGLKSFPTKNRNVFRKGAAVQGLFMASDAASSSAEQWGTMALAIPASAEATYRTAWLAADWGTPLLDFWDDLSDDGLLSERAANPGNGQPRASLAVRAVLPPGASREFPFYVVWHFPNRYAWSEKRLGNHYTTRFADAWDAAEKIAPRLPALEADTAAFVSAVTGSDLPAVIKEAALFNLSTLRTQTCFRTEDGRFYAWEGCNDKEGCCWGSCTHVWNYEQAVAFLFGGIARSLREVEFGPQTDPATGLMSFRWRLPLETTPWGKAAADGQMGCILKMHRDWQLSGDDAFLKAYWPKVRKAVEFCWIPGGWDADKDGVMEGCQHNTMDVEYYGPNPQMGLWYLGALRAAEEMARAAGDLTFAATCRRLFDNGSRWIDANLFNGRYYIHRVVPPRSADAIAPALLVGMGAADVTKPDYQLGRGCLVDQLVGQLLARVSGLGDLVKPENARATLASILKYNRRDSLQDHFNCLRTFALGDEAALLMAGYPDGRPDNPFPYFTEVMTGFEYTAAIGMLYEGLTEEGLRTIGDIRARYDGLKRNPFDEAECGHHYGRAMISWAGILAMTGFHYSGVEKTLTLVAKEGTFFWSNGYAYGTATMKKAGGKLAVTLRALKGEMGLRAFTAGGEGGSKGAYAWRPGAVQTVAPGRNLTFEAAPVK
ncbi:MAG: GH116 family glycosyl-hydrolase [Acidobacteriota bacterium]|nr:GH116 family glycosyl-hydrolase [Acidobacteriota bacterium]